MSAGFSLIETLIAMALTMAVVGTGAALVTPASRVSQTQPEINDMQQRARVAAETITRETTGAGAGFASRSLPSILPRRLGAVAGDSTDVARDSAITLLSVPANSPQTTTTAAISSGALTLTVAASPSCGSIVLCGFAAGEDVLIVDAAHFDVFRISSVSGGAAALRLHGQTLSGSYPAGSFITRATTRTLEFDAAQKQLRQYDGDANDQPVVDHLSRVSFSYWGQAVSGGLELMPLAMFTDGPWIGAGSSRFDSDLLRVRLVRATVESEAADSSLRSRVPPLTIAISAAPRSMSVAR